eukprot:TRINITY_DN694_c0_g1_i4.p1 TRINITY_DN694_c0_g1~~TRINITY_DN694_c0_g1_i4.p1  ORF type:complete len:174 (+),score=6.41 TRINITY_DN694_c0_g1_i4:259-780(+)
MHLVGLLCTIIQGNILSKVERETDLCTLESVKAASYTCIQAFNCLAEYIGLRVQFTINTGDPLVQTMMHHPRCVVIKEECGRGPYTINRVLLPQFQHVQQLKILDWNEPPLSPSSIEGSTFLNSLLYLAPRVRYLRLIGRKVICRVYPSPKERCVNLGGNTSRGPLKRAPVVS